ncbi:hypothetical protein LTR66_009818 [Elasticomyces elasticus]|nr:hypothetical protein LTR66_009818 [Elasticomyces elasticus]
MSDTSKTPDIPLTNGTSFSLHDGKTNVPDCDALRQAHKRNAELEAEVSFLTLKATAAADKLADYEDEIRQLRPPPERLSVNGVPPRTSSESSRPTSRSEGRAPTPTNVGRFSNFLSRKSVSDAVERPTTRENELASALAQEQSLRRAAEEKVVRIDGEIEELTATLFEQANEMVATERRARAKLEERVKILEQRDAERRRRLERLEAALGRVERVRQLLKP